MRDSDVREAMRTWLAAVYAHDPSSRFVEEMAVWNGSARIDMAVINGKLHGYEIKSERDTLARLDEQMLLYNQVFDRISLIAAEKHLHKAEARVSPWWGLTSAKYNSDGTLILCEVRPATANPSREKTQIARLLWRDELIHALEGIGKIKGMRSKSVNDLCEVLADSMSERALSAHVRQALKARHAWLGQARGDQAQVAARAD